MKKLLLVLIVAFTINNVKADEGMWLVHLIGEKTYADMVKRGLKLSKEQLYSMNKNSLKDAIVIFGGGCTAEVVSKEGLLFTNHHCGYDQIAARSTVANNYLKDGFWAKSKQEEIPCPGLSVQFLVKIDDVTAAVLEKLKDVKGNEITTKLPAILNEMSAKASEGTGQEVRISNFFKGNQFLQFTYQPYKDVRLVGTPPESIGKFGGDTDNWEWPRHTGDFSIFRVYMSADGKPSDYKTDNVPYKAKQFLNVSLKGVNDGDYAMIYGYPGGTNRYETSYGVKLKIDIENPNLVNLRNERLKLMLAEMVKDPEVKIQLASSYAGIANYWKFFDGETKQLVKHNVLAQKEKDEKTFETWAKGKAEYDNLFQNIKNTYDAWAPFAKGRVYLTEGVLGSPLMAVASNMGRVLDERAGKKPEDLKKAPSPTLIYERFSQGENMASDKKILAVVLKMYYKDVDPNQRPQAFYDMIQKEYGDLNSDDTYKKFADAVFEKTLFLNSAKVIATKNKELSAFNVSLKGQKDSARLSSERKELFKKEIHSMDSTFLSKLDTATLHQDIAYKTAMAFTSNFSKNYQKNYTTFIANNYVYNNLYLKGILEMKKGQALYPDANFTMRVSYGNVKSYSPKDGVKYSEVCTLDGVMEKYIPGDYEFDAPAKLIELIKAKDYGQYIDKKANDVVVSFITTNDITGGNSGSPVLNAKGELIGLAFDGNYEALSHKIAFDAELNRTICLDVRYLLFVVDKLGGAKNIIDELVLSK